MRLDLTAGRRAKSAAAWLSARSYLDTAVELLGDDPECHRDLWFACTRELAECDFLTGRFDEASERFDALRRRAVSRAERAEIATLQIRLLVVTGRYDESLALADSELAHFDAEFPTGRSELTAQLDAAMQLLRELDIAALPALPEARDPDARALIELYASLPPAIYSRRPELLPLLASRIVALSLRHGNVEASCFGYSMSAMLLAATLDDPRRALELSEMSVSLSQRLGDGRLRAPAVHIHANHILYWSHPYELARSFLDQAYAAAMHVGDITIAAYVSFMGAWQDIERSRPVAATLEALRLHESRARRSRHATAADVVRLMRQFVRALAGDSVGPKELTTTDFDAVAARARLAEAGLDTGLVMHDVLRAWLGWLHGDLGLADDALRAAATNLPSAYCLPVETTFATLDALIAAQRYDAASSDARPALMKRVEDAAERLESWSRGGNADLLAKAALVRAERDRLRGSTSEALASYERAAAIAGRSGGLLLQVAIATVAARECEAAGLSRAAVGWRQERQTLLETWGASALTETTAAGQGEPDTVLAGLSSGPEGIDVLTAIKASQALSRELVVEDLVRAVLAVVLENTGAERAVLFLAEDGELKPSASATAEEPIGSEDVDTRVPESILGYVKRARTPVVVDDAGKHPTYAADPYVVRVRPRSVLCTPILMGSELAGVLYLENTLTSGAFSADRIALLDVVTTQLAISLDNARLHHSQRRQAAETARLEAMRAGDARYRDVIESMSDGFFACDADWRLVAMNRVHEQATGTTREASLGQSLWDVFPGASDPERAFWPVYRRVMRDREAEQFIEHYAPLNLWVEVHAIPSRDGGIAVFYRDVGERRRAEAEREALLARELEARQLAEEASRAKDEFLAMLGHELRNPLAPILTALEIMQLRGEPHFARERAIIERQASHLVRLVDDLLDVSRIARGKFELNRARVDLASVVEEALEQVSPLFERSKHQVELTLERELFVDGDAGRLAQVATNLLSNAAKYTPAGGRVWVEARRDGDEVVLTVVDEGVGMSTDLLPRVFDLFVQSTQSIDRSRGGLGLGLTIVSRLVELHGGSVSAQSAGPGEGSTFEVRLPSAVPLQAVPSTQVGEAEAPRGSGRVLIVDDNVDAGDMLAIALQTLGFETRTAIDGPSALSLASTYRPHVGVLDIGLPVMDGYELAKRLRALPELEELRLVAVTGYGQPNHRDRALSEGFDAHLVKPVSLDELVALLTEPEGDG